MTQLRGEQPEAGLLADVVARSAGNPLFVEQLALTAREGSPLPANLHDLLHSRLASLPDDTRGVLGAAAVIGRRASLSLLTRTTGLAAEELDAALRPAVVAHVVEVDDDLRVDFHHPAFREVLEAGLMPGERTRLHLAAADALAADLERFPGVIGEMARHWHAVGELERALAAWVRAGEAYTRMDAFSDAWAAYRNVLELVQQVPHDLDVVGLTLLAAEAADLADEADAALPLLERVRAAATTDTVRATAAARTGWILFRRGGGDAAHRAFQDALALLPPDETSVLAARIQAGLALLAAGWSRLDEAEEAAAEALRIARAIGARREIGLALNAQGCVAALRGRLDEGVPLLREALAIAREGQDPQDLGAAYVNLSHVLGMAGLLGDAVELARVGIGELTRVGQERQQGSLLLHNVSEQLVEAGRYAEARELVEEALARHPRGIQAAPVLRTAARIAMTSGDLTTAWERCEQARLVVEVESAPVAWLREVLETAAEVELWAGRPDAAYDVVLDGLELVAGTDDEAFATALVALGLRALADSAAVHRDHRARTLRESQRRRLLAALESMRHHPGAGGQPDDAALALWVQAELGPPRRAARRHGHGRGVGRLGGRLDGPGAAVPVGVRALAGGRGAPGRRGQRGLARGAAGRARGRGRARRVAVGRGVRVARHVVPRRPAARCRRAPRGRPAGRLPPHRAGARGAAGAGRGAQQPGDRPGDVHQRQDGLGARLQHPAQARRQGSAGRRPDRAPAGRRLLSTASGSLEEGAAACDLRCLPHVRAPARFVPSCLVEATGTGEEVGPMDVAVLAGSVSTALFVGSYLPMLVKAFRTRDLDSYSRGNLVLATIGNAVYSVYVFSLPLGPIWFLHSFYVVATLLMLVWHVRHADQPDPPPANVDERDGDDLVSAG